MYAARPALNTRNTSGHVGFKLEEVEVSPSFFHRIMNTLILRPARWTGKFSPSCKVDANIKAVSIGIEVNGLDIPRLPQTKRDFKHLYVFHNVTTIPLLIISNSFLPAQNSEETFLCCPLPIYTLSTRQGTVLMVTKPVRGSHCSRLHKSFTFPSCQASDI